MLIEFNTDNHIEGKERVENYYTDYLTNALKRFEEKITRIEVHLGDENSDKFSTDDKRCMIEARVAGVNPLAVTHHADTIEKAISGATDKIKKVLETTFDKMRTH